jgi:HK97 gp10 family phage protein
MTIDVNVRIHGLTGIEAKIKLLNKRLAKKVLSKALTKGARPIVARARSLVPVDTGFIKRAIGARARRNPDGARRDVGVLSDIKGGGLSRSNARASKSPIKRRGKSKSSGLQGFKNSPTFYWRFLEFGTARMSAKPFLRPAFEGTKFDADAIIRREILIGIEQEVRKL